MIHSLHQEQFLPGDSARIWEFFATPRNLAAITPEHMRFETIGPLPEKMYPGQLIEYRIGIAPGFSTRWLTEITHVRDGSFFVDEQRIGPYRLWHHEHHFVPDPVRGGVVMRDQITYAVGWGPLGAVLHALWIRRKLESIFAHRREAIARFFTGGRLP